LIVDDIERLRMALDRVRDLASFHPADRVWWLYLRAAVEAVLVMHESEGLREAHARVKEFPETLPDEGERWLQLRSAALNALADPDRL
jgi:hypothetical protein